MYDGITGPVNSHSVSLSASLNAQEGNGSQNIQTTETVGKKV